MARMLRELHNWYLRNNELDEGDLLYFRINYRLIDIFGMTKEQAQLYHLSYHAGNPRHISQGYCEKCRKIVTIIPIIYGISQSEIEKMRIAEHEGRIIIGQDSLIMDGTKVAMFGCKMCKAELPRYGCL